MEKFATLKTQAEEIKALEAEIIELATLHAAICGANKTFNVVDQALKTAGYAPPFSNR